MSASRLGSGARERDDARVGPLDDDGPRSCSVLLQRAALPAETQQSLLERAGGNPLYAEEFVRMLRDREPARRGGRPPTWSLPDSLQALIAARLDTLSPDRKRLLQDAAVIGKVFWSGAAAAMGERDPPEVESALHELARKELVRPAGQSMEGEAEYGFWHVLVRDVAYGQIPRGTRYPYLAPSPGWRPRPASGSRTSPRCSPTTRVKRSRSRRAMQQPRPAGAGYVPR